MYISFINLTHPNKLLWLALKEPTSQKLNIFMIKMKLLEIMKLLFFFINSREYSSNLKDDS